jgi:hypothetical protein
VTRIVTAKQKGKAIFVSSCSFAVPDKGITLNHQVSFNVTKIINGVLIHENSRKWPMFLILTVYYRKLFRFPSLCYSRKLNESIFIREVELLRFAVENTSVRGEKFKNRLAKQQEHVNIIYIYIKDKLSYQYILIGAFFFL